MNNKIYTVHAYRWGDREYHSYSHGVFTDKVMALESAEEHQYYRGGKYTCEVIEWSPNTTDGKVILPLVCIRGGIV